MRDFDALETRASKLKKSEKRKNRGQKIVILAKMDKNGQKWTKNGKKDPRQIRTLRTSVTFEIPLHTPPYLDYQRRVYQLQVQVARKVGDSG